MKKEITWFTNRVGFSVHKTKDQESGVVRIESIEHANQLFNEQEKGARFYLSATLIMVGAHIKLGFDGRSFKVKDHIDALRLIEQYTLVLVSTADMPGIYKERYLEILSSR